MCFNFILIFRTDNKKLFKQYKYTNFKIFNILHYVTAWCKILTFIWKNAYFGFVAPGTYNNIIAHLNRHKQLLKIMYFTFYLFITMCIVKHYVTCKMISCFSKSYRTQLINFLCSLPVHHSHLAKTVYL